MRVERQESQPGRQANIGRKSRGRIGIGWTSCGLGWLPCCAECGRARLAPQPVCCTRLLFREKTSPLPCWPCRCWRPPVLHGCVTAKKYDDLSARQKADAEGKADRRAPVPPRRSGAKKSHRRAGPAAPHPKAPRDRLGRNRRGLPQNPQPLQRAEQQLRQAAQKQRPGTGQQIV